MGNFDRLGHWPYAAEHCKSILDLDHLEEHAVRILARGIQTQRLVSFVGAGASMAYGRLTWNGMMSSLFQAMEQFAEERKDTLAATEWERIRNTLWPKGVSDFLAYSDNAVKSQILSDVMQLEEHGGPGEVAIDSPAGASRLQQETKHLLEDFYGFVEGLIASLYPDGALGVGTGSSLEKRLDARVEAKLADARKKGAKYTGRRGLAGVLDLLHAAERKGSPAQSELRDSLVQVLSGQSVDLDSPIRHLAMDWSIRRFITTNYDSEIERGLQELKFVRRNGSAADVRANQYESLSFSRNATGQALRFALEGPRRHAAILHLHGDIADASSLIISESHYQRLYLDDHPLRDLVNNAAQANFAANPMLFVGSDVSEDDVLRPMREFMSGVGHRRDRMAVALFVATKEGPKRAQRRVQLLVKHGVHAIDVGFAHHSSSGNTARVGEPWLYELYKELDAFRTLVKAATQSGSRRVQLGSTVKITRRLIQLAQVDTVEGVLLDDKHPLFFLGRLASLRKLLESSSGKAITPFALERLSELFENSFNWIAGCFLCAKLMDLRRTAVETLEDDAKLAMSYERPLGEPREVGDAPRKQRKVPEGGPVVRKRHAVLLDHCEFVARFSRIHREGYDYSSDTAFDEGLGHLFDAVRNERGGKFAEWHGRRVVIACAARGYGKGGQFDRLVALTGNPKAVANERFDGSRDYLRRFMEAMGHYPLGAEGVGREPLVFHANMSFSNELGPIISQVTRILRESTSLEVDPECSDQMELLERALRAMAAKKESARRVLIVLGNAGVLYDAEGQPKNGQIRRVMRQLLSPRFRDAPIDILMYVGESQIPAAVREPRPEEKEGKKANAEDSAPKEPSFRESDPPDQRLRRRLERLNIRTRLDPREFTMIHPLARSRVSDLAGAYFHDLSVAMGWAGKGAPQARTSKTRFPPKYSVSDRLARTLYLATGGSRYAQTIVLALLDACRFGEGRPAAEPAYDHPASEPRKLLGEALIALNGPPSGSAIETAIEFVLDRWASWHLLGKTVRPASLPSPRDGADEAIIDAMRELTAPLTPEGWNLASELMWHLGAFSHPVERSVLLSCPRVVAALGAMPRTLLQRRAHREELIVEAMLELLAHWCLVFRVAPRPLPMGLTESPGLGFRYRTSRYRYAPHRHMQRHLLRMMGGRNVEPTQWDQFTTTTYASLPDESPSLRANAHRTLTEVVHTLTRYPGTMEAWPSGEKPMKQQADTVRAMVTFTDRIRAAYYLARSTYSFGVISHLAPDQAADATHLGHMEQYRRLVRWITHAAKYWEREYILGAAPGSVGRRWCTETRPRGIFYPGELIWLYNECGVISLAMGKLHDAEHLLTMGERAARLVEGDDSGSLHVRVRLHSALVQIERGRPHRARLMLAPIADRRNGHPVPPMIAESYLGLVEHIGGNYTQARDHYDKALKGLRRHRRARASAFALIGLADVEHKLHPSRFDDALSLAEEAISLAQQGGHEDLRVMAMLERIRICVEATRTDGQNLFEQLSFAQQYARRMDLPRIACDVHELRARMLMKQGEFHMSAADATASLEIAAKYDLKLKKARGILTLAQIYHRRSEIEGARTLAAMGREIAVSCDYYACVKGFKELELLLGAPVRMAA
jgi:hypothetical protein